MHRRKMSERKVSITVLSKWWLQISHGHYSMVGNGCLWHHGRSHELFISINYHRVELFIRE